MILITQTIFERGVRRAFTLMELMMVMLILSIVAAFTIPAVKSLTKSNDHSQAVNLVKSMISTARSIAISQHRMAGVVFFDETAQYSKPVNTGQTAMQLFVEDYNQASYGDSSNTYFVYYSTARQYVPQGIKVAVLTDVAGANVVSGDNNPGNRFDRVILFDAEGNLSLRGNLATRPPGVGNDGTQGTYPTSYGDWLFEKNPNVGVAATATAPGFFLFNQTDYAAAVKGGAIPAAWIKQNGDVVVVNANTGSLITGN